MKNRKILYCFMNLLFLAMSLIFIDYTDILKMSSFSVLQLIVLASICIIIHFFKFIRIYFILLEEKISIRQMLKIYIKTTFVSTVIPFKAGEVFKMYSYGQKINNYPKGIISILIDKFFDAVILCAVLIPCGIIKNKSIPNLAVIMLIFLVIILITFTTFEGTYYYLNKFFVINGRSKKSIYALNLIEKTKKVYISAKDMLKGRGLILMVLTFISWLFELLFVQVLSKFMNAEIEFSRIVDYISDAFWGTSNLLFNKYIYMCTAIFLVVLIIIYANKFIARGRQAWKK